MKLRSILILFMSCSLLTGCFATMDRGWDIEPNHRATDGFIASTLLANHITKKEVLKEIGQPQNIVNCPDGNSNWYYFSYKMHTSAVTGVPIVGLFAGGHQHELDEFIYIFDTDNKLIKVKKNSYNSGYANVWKVRDIHKRTDIAEWNDNVKAEFDRCGLPFTPPKDEGSFYYAKGEAPKVLQTTINLLKERGLYKEEKCGADK